MLLIPAIDLKDGYCVRLKQGDMDQSTIFSEDPAAMARKWVEAGARRLHLVDLNGAFAGKPQNQKPMTEAEYRELRGVFEDSRYNDIRDHGTKLMDVVWQMSQAIDQQGGADAEDGASLGAALAYMQPLMTHMTGLQSACADQGVIVNLKNGS